MHLSHLCIDGPKYLVCLFLWLLCVLINPSMQLSQSLSCWSYQVTLCMFPPSVGCLSKVLWWICLPGVSHSLTFDCYGDINLQSIIFSLSYLIICQFSEWVFCLGGKDAAQTCERCCFINREINQLPTTDCCPWTTAQELQIWAVYGSPKHPRASSCSTAISHFSSLVQMCCCSHVSEGDLGIVTLRTRLVKG